MILLNFFVLNSSDPDLSFVGFWTIHGLMYGDYVGLKLVTSHVSIGFPGQIRKFDNQIHFNFIQIRQILSYRENYHSNSFSYHSI